MRARPPVTRVEAQHLIVRTELVDDDGAELPPIEVSLPVAHADLLDPTATPTAAVLATLAAARGEDLVIEGPVDTRAAEGAADVARLLAGWWGTDSPKIEFETTSDSVHGGDGVGLFFSRGVDSWSTLLDLLDADPGKRVTHLIAVQHGDARYRPVDAAIIDGHRAVAAELGLELVPMATTARVLLDPLQPWVRVAGPTLVATGLTAGSGLGCLVYSGVAPLGVPIRSGSDPEVISRLSTTGTEVIVGNPDRFRHERIAHVAARPFARDRLQVCWEGLTAGNCGVCSKCLTTMSGLLLAGDPDPSRGFDVGIDVERVRATRLKAAATSGLIGALAEGLAPEHEELRRAWADVWALAHGDEPKTRWGDGAPPGLAGPGVPQRVAAGLRTATGQAEAPVPAPLGWLPGSVPLRPPLAAHDRIRALIAAAPERPGAWAIVEHHVRDGDRDARQADLALRTHTAFGPGACYLPGLLWALGQPPVLDHTAVATLLRTARVRLWWRAAGDLEPLRVVETIEQGCLPVQVMPVGPAHDLAARLPPPLAALVVSDEAMADLDLSAPAVAARLGPVVEHVLAGSSDRDLVAGAYGA